MHIMVVPVTLAPNYNTVYAMIDEYGYMYYMTERGRHIDHISYVPANLVGDLLIERKVNFQDFRRKQRKLHYCKSVEIKHTLNNILHRIFIPFELPKDKVNSELFIMRVLGLDYGWKSNTNSERSL